MRRLAALLACTLGAAPVLAAESDPYAALSAMDGRWTRTTAGGRAQAIENRCKRIGLFFVCEQSVAAKPAALVVFLPRETEGRRQVFRVETLTAAGDRAGPWKQLVVEGDTWTVTDLGHVHGKVRRERTVLTHSGPDFIHDEVQASEDGETWTTVAAADERRAP
jgi:hypothetical protein